MPDAVPPVRAPWTKNIMLKIRAGTSAARGGCIWACDLWKMVPDIHAQMGP